MSEPSGSLALMRRISIAVPLLATALLAACGGRTEEAPPPQVAPVVAADHYSGHWRGLARISSTIPNAPENMDISATMTQDARECGTIEYGAIGCNGVWLCSNGFDSPSMTIEEQIRFGQGERCPGSARVELRTTNDPNRLEFHYSAPGIEASGTLSRDELR